MEESVDDAAGRPLTASPIAGGGAGPGVKDLGNGWREKEKGSERETVEGRGLGAEGRGQRADDRRRG